MIMLLFFILIISPVLAATAPSQSEQSTDVAFTPNVDFDNSTEEVLSDEELLTEEENIPTGPIKPIPLLSNNETVVTEANQIPVLNDNKSKNNPSIYLNFEGAALSSILNYLGEQKK